MCTSSPANDSQDGSWHTMRGLVTTRHTPSVASDPRTIDDLVDELRATANVAIVARRAVLAALLEAGDAHLTADELAPGYARTIRPSTCRRCSDARCSHGRQRDRSGPLLRSPRHVSLGHRSTSSRGPTCAVPVISSRSAYSTPCAAVFYASTRRVPRRSASPDDSRPVPRLCRQFVNACP